MWNLLTRIFKRLLFVAGVCVIVLAMSLGAFRLLLAQLPSYQAELQKRVADKLGMAIEFEQLDGRWGLGGPELTLRQVSLGAGGEAQEFLRATRAFVAFDPWALVLERELTVRELRLDGVRLVVERGADGRLRFQGLPVDPAGGGFADLVPAEVALLVRDGQLLYIDRPRRRSWQFVDVAVNMARARERVAVELRASPPAELAANIDLSLTTIPGGAPGSVTWQVSADLGGTDLGELAQLLPVAWPFSIDGSGDASLSVDWARDRVARVAVDLDLSEVALPDAGGSSSTLERAELRAEWTRAPERGWQLALDDVELVRDGQPWLVGGDATVNVERADGQLGRVTVQGDFFRLEDFSDFVPLLPESRVQQRWRALEPRGELTGLDVALERVDGEWDYSVAGRFAGIAFASVDALPGVSGLSGDVRASAHSGTVVLDSAATRFEWPGLLRDAVQAEGLGGVVVWREGRDVVRVVSNDLELELLGEALRSSFELALPLDGSAARLDLDTRLAALSLVEAKRLLPVGIMPGSVVAWLDGAVRAGTARNITLDFFGPLDAFPFDDGSGQFSATADIDGAELAFVSDWPHALELNGRVEFRDAAFEASGAGRVLGNRSDDIAVAIADLRDAVLTLSAETIGPLADVLAFLRGAPLIADSLGPGYERLQAHAGTGAVRFDLALPLLDMPAFELEAALAMSAAELSVDGFGPRATEVHGVLNVSGATVTGDGIEGVLFDGPVVARVTPAAAPAYRAELHVEGETNLDAVLRAFSLPFEDLVAGPTRWEGSLALPARGAGAPARIDVQSNLSGVALHFPEPLAKTPAEPSNLQLEFVFASDAELRVLGNLGATRRFALEYGLEAGRFAFRRGAVRFGGEQPELPDEPGIVVAGRLPLLDFSDWLALGKTSSIERAQPLFLRADLELSEFWAFGQRLGMSRLSVDRAEDAWQIELASEAIAGRVTVPRPLTGQARIVADMERVYLATGDGVNLGGADPRALPGLSLRAAEFGFGNRRLGEVEAEIMPDPLGLRFASFTSQSASFTAEGSGSWLRSGGGETTRFAASIDSTDVASALDELGLGAVIEGEVAELSASVYWSGPPSAAWLDHVNGDVALRVEQGSLVEIDPGAGRVVGLMSIAALPRRLALDFRDVFNKGFAFDEITGDFTIIDGNAYTNNLKMSGPSAEIGVVGRTGLRDRDYRQQAVVTAEPGNMLPTVGGILGGPGVGAALFVFTRLFKEPLKGIGRASYCVTGTWDEPEVERLSGDEREAERCAELPEAMRDAEPGSAP